MASQDACPGGQQLDLGLIKNNDMVCKTGSYNRGWGTGCGLFGLIEVRTCVNIRCDDSFTDVKVLSHSQVLPIITLKIGTEKVTKAVPERLGIDFKTKHL